MSLSKTIFVNGTPTQKELDALGRWGTIDFKRDDPHDKLVYCCDTQSAKIRIIENAILAKTTDKELLSLIEDFGHERWAEGNQDGYDAGAGND